jgi:tetratricopeptide (TPR) repeat protein
MSEEIILQQDENELLEYQVYAQNILPQRLFTYLLEQGQHHEFDGEIVSLNDSFATLEENLKQLYETGEYEQLIKLTTLYSYPLLLRSKWAEVRYYVEQALHLSTQLSEIEVNSLYHLWNVLGMTAKNQGDYFAAKNAFTQILILSQRNNNQIQEADVLFHLAALETDRSNYTEAQKMYRKSLELKRALVPETDWVFTMIGLSYVEAHQGHNAEALALIDEALQLANKHSHRRLQSHAYYARGFVTLQLKNYSAARAAFLKAQELKADLSDEVMSNRIIQNLGRISYQTQQYNEAEELLRVAIENFQRLHFPRGEISARGDLALVLKKKKQYTQARKLLESCYQDCLKLDNNRGLLKINLELLKLDVRQFKLTQLPARFVFFYKIARQEGFTPKYLFERLYHIITRQQNT